MKIFPLVWLFGPGMRGAVGLIKKTGGLKDRIDMRHMKLVFGAIATMVVIESAALGSYGVEAARTHAENIREHIKPEELSSRRLGFALAQVYRGEHGVKIIKREHKLEIKEKSGARLMWSLLVLLPLGFSLYRRRDDEAFAYGLIPFFMLSTASYYYYVCRLPLVIFHAAHLEQMRHRVGLAFFFGLELFANWAETVYPGYRWFNIGWHAWSLTVYSVVMTAWLYRESQDEADAERALEKKEMRKAKATASSDASGADTTAATSAGTPPKPTKGKGKGGKKKKKK